MDEGYFRLSGYWRYFQVDPASGQNDFLPGTDFSVVLDVYRQDAHVRNLLLEGLSQLEISLRAILAGHMCVVGQAGSEYLNRATYDDSVDRQTGLFWKDKLLNDIATDIQRSKERHISHYRDGNHSHVPFWVAGEALSFGVLSRMYGLLADESLRERIARRFGYISTHHFHANLRAMSVFRNVCAHHSRLWNRHIRQDVPRTFGKLIEPSLVEADYRNTVWGAIAVLSDLVEQIRRDSSFQADVAALVPRSGVYWLGLVQPSNK
jgi:abortive infection bacteriophage resistance protein